MRSSHRRCSVRKDILRNFAKFKGKHLCQSLFFNKVAGRPATLFKKRLWRRCFLVSFAKFLRTPFFTEHLQKTTSELLPVAINLKRYTPEIGIIVFYTTCGVSCTVILLPELTALIDQRAKHHWCWNEPEESNKNFLKTHCK